MRMMKVTSSNIDQIGYDTARMQLGVQFRSGRKYVFDGVPLVTWLDFKGASSHGSYFNQVIKGKYETTELESDANWDDHEASPPNVATLAFRPGAKRFALFA